MELTEILMVVGVLFLAVLVFWFMNSPVRFLYEKMTIMPYPLSDLIQDYHGTDCISDGSCRLSPNNDSFFYYPSASNITDLTKVKCQSSIGCKLENCSNVLTSSGCDGGCYQGMSDIMMRQGCVNGECLPKSSYVDVPGRPI